MSDVSDGEKFFKFPTGKLRSIIAGNVVRIPIPRKNFGQPVPYFPGCNITSEKDFRVFRKIVGYDHCESFIVRGSEERACDVNPDFSKGSAWERNGSLWD